VVDLALDLAGGGGGGGGLAAAAYYYGYSSANVTWSSLVWSDIHNALTIVDDATVDISRVNSTFTFAQAGVYAWDIDCSSYNSTGSDFVMLRARRSGVTIAVGGPMGFAESGAGRVAAVRLSAILQIAAGDAVTVQYAVAPATFNAFVPIAIDGEPARSAALSIYRIGS
jgi:hypothetical protein